MNMFKRIIIIVMVIVIIIISIILLYMYFIGKEDNEYTYIEENNFEIKKNVQKVENRNDYYMINTCVDKWFSYLMKTNSDDYNTLYEGMSGVIQKEEENSAIALYNMLDPIYIEYKDINEKNVFEKIQRIEKSDILIEDMYFSQISENILSYIVYGKIYYENNNNMQNFTMIVNVDMDKNAFSLILQDYIDEKQISIDEGEEFNIQLGKNIESNQYNMIEYRNISDEVYIEELVENLRKMALYDKELLYQHLNQDYSKKRFDTSYDIFQNFMKENMNNFIKMSIKSYQKNQYDGYVQYVCVDNSNNYYIFNINGITDYNIILDTYTVDLPQFLEKYENGNEQVKVGMNIEKFISSINMKDYKYAYNCLAESFKANSYQTQESFEEYVKSNFFEKNKIEYESFSKEGENYIYEIKISDEQGISQDVKNVTIIMQLKEGTDFVMSFSIN